MCRPEKAEFSASARTQQPDAEFVSVMCGLQQRGERGGVSAPAERRPVRSHGVASHQSRDFFMSAVYVFTQVIVFTEQQTVRHETLVLLVIHNAAY